MESYATFNPHAGFYLYRDGETRVVSDPLLTDWHKWFPNFPTNAHWYTVEDLSGLIAAYITAERDKKDKKTLRKFISEFSGLSGTRKTPAVTNAAGLSGLYLHDLIKGNGIDVEAVERLLKAMCAESKPVKASKLGIIGEEALSKRMVEINGVKEGSIQYAKTVSDDPTRPQMCELALGYREEDKRGKRVRFGLNFSPALGIPRRAWPRFLQKAMVDEYDPICITVHQTNPRFGFTNRGKSMLGGRPNE